MNARIRELPCPAISPAPSVEDRTAIVAQQAIALIRTLKLPATPRIYELCYAYATSEYPSLNLVINDLLARRIEVGDATIKQIGARYIPQTDDRDGIDTVGLRVSKVIDQVLGALGTIIGAESAYSADLGQTGEKIAILKSRNSLIDEIKTMMQSASQIDGDHRRLEEKLNASIDEINELRDQLQKIRDARITDPLTGLPNRQSFEASLHEAIAAIAEQGSSLCLALCDFDEFKQFNDAWGHVTGDQVLCLVAMELKQKVGALGIVARLGGAQFAIILPDTSMEDARGLADHIRSAIVSREITIRSSNQKLGRISVSFGIGEGLAESTPNALLLRTQTCLRAAKDQGRNRVVCENDPDLAAPELKVAFA